MITYSEHSGASPEDAIIIYGAAHHSEGVRAEYDYLDMQFGRQGVDWSLVLQALLHHESRPIDRMSIMLADGSAYDVYFDLSEFFGKF